MRVQIINEVPKVKDHKKGEWKLYFQYCLYVYDNGTSENGYRFIWRVWPEDGNIRLLPTRGQARIPSIADAVVLLNKAKEEGWGNHICK